MPKYVTCYDCGARVRWLREHRTECPNSRYAKSIIREQGAATPGEPPPPIVPVTTDVTICLDVSGSMSGAPLIMAKACLLESVAKLDEDDRIAIITFDSKAFFKLRPRPVGQIRRQNELGPLMDRIFARGATAAWDALWLALDEVRDTSRKTTIIAITDGMDNSSKRTLEQVAARFRAYPNISLGIAQIGANVPAYADLAKATGGWTFHCEDTETFHKTFTVAFEASMKRSAGR